MELLYLTDAKIPSRSTNSIQATRMCAAFQQAGANVTLLTPKYKLEMPEGFNGDIWEFYGIKEPFNLIQFPTMLPSRLAQIRSLTIALRFAPYFFYIQKRVMQSNSPITIYGRSSLGIWIARHIINRSKKKVSGVFQEIHDFPSDQRSKNALSSLDGIVAISQALKNEVVEKLKIDPTKILVAHDGADVNSDLWNVQQSKEYICREYGLDIEKPIVLYTGRLFKEKGADLILDIAENFHDQECQFLLVGKIYDNRYKLRIKQNLWKHVVLTGFIPPAQIPQYMSSSDIVLLPSLPELPYARFMSPLKLFEYMASGKPIIASDLPVIREVLQTNHNALLVSPYTPSLWADAIRTLLQNPALRNKLSSQSLYDVQEYSWHNRAIKIMKFLRGENN